MATGPRIPFSGFAKNPAQVFSEMTAIKDVFDSMFRPRFAINVRFVCWASTNDEPNLPHTTGPSNTKSSTRTN